MNIEDFLNPISEESPCGEYLIYDYAYDQIKEYMREDDPRLSQGVWQVDMKKADWKSAITTISDLLKTKTKDLQLLVWITESLFGQDGLPGLSEGVDVTLAVAEKFWDKIYPTDEDNRRMMPFFYLETKLSQKLVQLPITESLDNTVGAFTLSDWLTAQYNFKIKSRKGITLDQIRKILQASSNDFLQAQKKEVEQSVVQIKRVIDFVNKHSTGESPGFSKPLEYFETLQTICDKTLEQKKSSEEESAAQTKEEVKPETSQEQKIETDSIEKAYLELEDISKFLEKAQPQSPASTLIKIAINIGKKSFNELLDINTKNNSAVMNTIFELYKMLVVNEKKG